MMPLLLVRQQARDKALQVTTEDASIPAFRLAVLRPVDVVVEVLLLLAEAMDAVNGCVLPVLVESVGQCLCSVHATTGLFCDSFVVVVQPVCISVCDGCCHNLLCGFCHEIFVDHNSFNFDY